jgi:hypothetical protein
VEYLKKGEIFEPMLGVADRVMDLKETAAKIVKKALSEDRPPILTDGQEKELLKITRAAEREAGV